MVERLGRYILERRLAAGGMAEVFLARQSGPAGFEKLCVIKRMLPALSGDAHFVRMFLDEARLVAQLNHPNIAQIYDFGEEDGSYFLAMEYVPGANLREVVKDHARRGATIPFAWAARLVAQAAAALDYAHDARGVHGESLEIVHRDVSPQNILLGQSGVVKLIDFGVAKAATASTRTATGMIKGKVAYMSPEQLRGKPLDRRSDVFGLGLVLYELIATRRAIRGDSEVALMQAAMRMQIPPLESARPGVPEPLRKVVERALARDREERYPTAAALAAELEQFLIAGGTTVTGAELATLLPGDPPTHPAPPPFWGPPDTAPTIIDPNRRVPPPPPRPADALGRTGGGGPVRADERAAAAPTMVGQAAPAPAPAPAAKRITLRERGPRTPAAAIAHAETVLRPPRAVPPSAGASASETRQAVAPSRVPWMLASALLAAGVAVVAYAALSRPARMVSAPGSTAAPVPTAASPGPAQTPPRTLPSMQQQSAPAAGPTAAAASPLPVAEPGPGSGEPAPAAPPSRQGGTVPAAAPAPAARPRPPADVAPEVPAPAMPPTERGAKNPSARSPAGSGATLRLSSSPRTLVTVDGEPRGQTPLSVNLAAGEHSVVLGNDALGLRREYRLQLASGEQREVDWRAEHGTVAFRAVPYAEVFLGDQRLGLTPLQPVELWEGTHRFRFVNRETGRSELREVEVQPGRETVVKVDLRAQEQPAARSAP